MSHPRRLALVATLASLVVTGVLAQAPPEEAGASRPAPSDTVAPAQVTFARLRQELHRADQFLLESRFEDALAALRIVTGVQPDHAGAWLLTARASSGLGRHVESLEAARRAVQLLEREPSERRAGWMPSSFYLQLGRSCAQAGDLACALESLRRADKEEPESSEILRELGSVQLRLGQDADAAATLQRAARLAPDSPRTQVELGNALLRVERVAEAEAAFRAAAELAPSEPEPHFGLASAAGARGDESGREAALGVFEKLTAQREQRMETARRLDEALQAAGVHLTEGRFAEAAAAFAVIAADPAVEQEGYKKPLVLLDLGRSLRLAGDLEGAAQALERAAAAGPRVAAVHLEWGSVLAEAGYVDEAFPHLLRAVELDGLQVAPHASLALAWAALGRLDEALAETAKASLLAPEDLVLRRRYIELLAASGRGAEAQSLAQRGGLAAPGEAASTPAGGQPAPDRAP